jgi:8-amino-7-oxononanoate synthase
MLSKDGVAIFIDAGAYPIARWGVERAAAQGAPVYVFPQHDVGALGILFQRNGHHDRRPVVVTDGFSPGRGRSAPLAEYLECVRPFGGEVLIDDTQALGVFGHSAGRHRPYGVGGGGSLRWHDIGDPTVTVISSLAKAFGVPVAVMAGSDATISRFASKSETRVHCSPPSVAAIQAADHALNVNEQHGSALRWRLARNVRRFRARLAVEGFAATGGLFPVQTLRLKPEQDASRVHERLQGLDIETVLHHSVNSSRPCLSFIITARHTHDEIDWAVEALASALSIQSDPKPALAAYR